MNSIILNCQTVTPMFSGNVYQNAEIRPTEIKSAMRFWWRAMQTFADLNELKKAEAQIFGGSWKENGKEKSKRADFDIEVVSNNQPVKSRLPDGNGAHIYSQVTSRRNFRYNILDYLCYGRSDRGTIIKSYIPPDSKFQIILKTSDATQIEQLKKLVWFSGTLSGIGGKSRNGYGNYMVEGYTSEEHSTLFNSLQTTSNRKDYTSFSADTHIYVGVLHDSWHDALDEIGVIYKETRESMEPKHNGEKRKYIGSPLVVDGYTVSNLNRHSKFLFLNVVKLVEQFQGLIICLPYTYLQNAPDSIISPGSIPGHQSNYNTVYNQFITSLGSSSLTEIF